MRLYVVHIINIDDNNCKYQCYKKFRNILVEDFNYPHPHLTLEKCLSMDTASYEKIRLTTNSWYKSFYSTFSPTVCKELLYKAINT